MELKYVMRNDKYIIDRKFDYSDEARELNTYKIDGRMVLNNMLPIENENTARSIAEHALDKMKNNALDMVKKKYFLSDNEIINFYFEGDVERDNNDVYIKINGKEILVNHVQFKLDFEVELKVNPKNFFKIKYDIFKFRMSNSRTI